MAMVSGMGFSGLDYNGTLFEHGLNVGTSAAMAAYNSKLQYRYAKKYAENGPTWNRTGLEKAGLNPIAFMANGSAGSLNTPAINNNAPEVHFGDSGFDANAFQSAKNAAKRTELENENAEAQINKTNAEASAAQKQGDAALISAKAAELNSKTNVGAAVEHGFNRTVSSALDTAMTAGKLKELSNASKMTGAAKAAAQRAAASDVIKRVALPVGTVGAAASSGTALGAGAIGLGSAGAFYGLGKLIESAMTEEDHKAFDRAAKNNVRMRRESGKPIKPVNPSKKRRHN